MKISNCSSGCMLAMVGTLLIAAFPAVAQQPQACCLPDGSCAMMDPQECLTIPGAFTGGVGSMCLGDGNNNGVDDACESTNECRPTPDHQACAPTDCPVAGEECLPACVRIGPDGVPAISACDCRFPNECHVNPDDPAAGCVGECPPGEVCRQDVFTYPDETVEICCNCVPEGGEDEACCFSDGTCQNLPAGDCQANGGIPQGPGAVCTAPEACCLDDATCMDVDPLCCDDMGGTPLGAGSMCLGDSDGDGKDDACSPPQPVCPLATDYCAEFQSRDCQTDDPAASACFPKGVIVGPNLNPIVEACECYSGEDCGPVAIDPVGGDFVVSCPGTCPDPNARCQVFVDGVPTGAPDIPLSVTQPGQVITCDCPEPAEDEACCFADGTCTNMPAPDCVQNGGTPQGPGSMCTAPVACCLPDDTCAMIDPICCDDLGGTVIAGAACTTTGPEGCCYDDGSCADIDPVCCVANGGTPQGPGSMCLGDNDGDGNDDLCVPPPPVCPLATELCAPIQTRDCQTSDPDLFACFPTGVVVGPNLNPIVEECACFNDTDCGPVVVDPIAGTNDYFLACPGDCPDPAEPCEIHIDGMPIGMASTRLSQVPAGSIVTCDCAPVPDDEACCLPDGTCIDAPPANCIANGGTPGGPGSACSGVVTACCLPDGSCRMVDQTCCDDLGGTTIPGATCSANEEACCLPDGTCTMADPLCCVEQGGAPGGAGSMCTAVEACCLDDGSCVDLDPVCCLEQGGMPQGAGSNCDNVVCEDPGDEFVIEFSLDIGSDTELSDPFANGNEGADPGDVYWWRSAPYAPPLQPCGRDGFKDDAFIFGFDPSPSAPDCAMPPATAVPVGNGGDPQDYYELFFDLDGHDQLSLELSEFIPPTAPLPGPLPQEQLPPTQCIYPPQFLLMSFDDDKAAGWPAGDVPVTAASPAGAIHGRSAVNDEVVGLTLAGGGFPVPVALTYRPFDEVDIHDSMRPNPDMSEREDDDVDSLDIVRGPQVCPFWYFSPDHEARRGLDPGSIYLATGGGAPVKVIDDAIHLGLDESTDIDAFEFTWLNDELIGGPGMSVLAVLFSVDDDDPLTPVDESGGLNPRQIYASLMTGGYVPLLSEEDLPRDDVDALTIWIAELLPPCNPADVNCDGFVNGLDVAAIKAPGTWSMPVGMAICPRADVNGDGNINGLDIAAVKAPGTWQTSTGPCECPNPCP